MQHVFGGSMQYYRRVNPRGEALISKNTYGKEKLNLHIICRDMILQLNITRGL